MSPTLGTSSSPLFGASQYYAEAGTLPNFNFASFMELLGWATPPEPEAG